MRLIKLKFTNFRRFDGEQSLDLNENLIALVGPNEAGKSSILAAIDMVGRRVAPGQADITRGLTSPASIAALFSLEASDTAALADIHDGPTVSRVWITRSADEAGSTWSLEPDPHRDLSPR